MQAEVIRTRDPALDRLLRDLPKGDPDAEPPAMAEVWVAFCDRSQTVPVGVPTDVDFGTWQGPEFPSGDVLIHAKNLRTSTEGSTRVRDIGWSGPAVIRPGDKIRATKLTISV